MSNRMVLIASTSKAIIEYVEKGMEEIGAQNTIITADNPEELQKALLNERPYFLLIEGCFFGDATPEELYRLIRKFNSLRVFVFSFHEYSDKHIKLFFKIGMRATWTSGREGLNLPMT